ncbi:MAG: NFACT family protein [Lachnospiraceae bacterium]|nr:NFACT family protein [Lachnospiraceae bacterium]
MALDGIVIANIVQELSQTITGGRINKIAQTESDELLLTIKNEGKQYRLLISVNASLPLMYLSPENKTSPLVAPGFCMLLRKHLGNGKILSVKQVGMERAVDFTVEHLDEMGDLCVKHLMVELMGKHSNIIFCDDKNCIIDAIKRISAQISSVREVLPGREYFIPDAAHKYNPCEEITNACAQSLFSKPMAIGKALYTTFTGISPCIASEVCYLASIPAEQNAADCTENEKIHLLHIFGGMMEEVKAGHFHPQIVLRDQEPVEYAAIELTNYTEDGLTKQDYTSISELLYVYYREKNTISRMRQKSVDLRKIVNTLLERDGKKLDLLEKQMEDTKKKEQYRLYGELLNTYGYQVEEGAKSYVALNYYTNEEVTIPLDENKSAHENAKRYFDKYSKCKRTEAATTSLIEETKAELTHLESIANSLDLATTEEDLVQIKEELMEAGYVHRKGPQGKKTKMVSKPLHYMSEDGFHFYVGKNNYQNEELDFKIASGGDWWFHAKDMAGSHVIVKTEGNQVGEFKDGALLPDHIYEIAAALAAHYSKGKNLDRVEVDYTLRKNLKKPAVGKPGMVIYHTNYSLMISPKIQDLPIEEL